MSTRLSLSTLANQRVAIFKERAAVREDYYVAHHVGHLGRVPGDVV